MTFKNILAKQRKFADYAFGFRSKQLKNLLANVITFLIQPASLNRVRLHRDYLINAVAGKAWAVTVFISRYHCCNNPQHDCIHNEPNCARLG